MQYSELLHVHVLQSSPHHQLGGWLGYSIEANSRCIPITNSWSSELTPSSIRLTQISSKAIADSIHSKKETSVRIWSTCRSLHNVIDAPYDRQHFFYTRLVAKMVVARWKKTQLRSWFMSSYLTQDLREHFFLPLPEPNESLKNRFFYFTHEWITDNEAGSPAMNTTVKSSQ